MKLPYDNVKDIKIVPVEEIPIADVKVTDEMVRPLIPTIRAMAGLCCQLDALGIASNQVGLKERFLLIRKEPAEFITMFNPQIDPIKKKGLVNFIEGCLSLPGKLYKTERWAEVQARWMQYTPGGRLIFQVATFRGVLAFVIQHEMDHLNGLLISRGEEIKLEDIEKEEKEEKSSNIEEIAKSEDSSIESKKEV